MRPKPLNHFQISADLNYYISVQMSIPMPSWGSKKYTLDSAFWKKIDPSPYVSGISFTDAVQSRQIGEIPYGFAIFDDKGNQIGIMVFYLTGQDARADER